MQTYRYSELDAVAGEVGANVLARGDGSRVTEDRERTSCPRQVLVHIGWPKSGTTSVQRALHSWPNLAGKPLDRDGGDLAATWWQCLLTDPRADSTTFDALVEQSAVEEGLPVVASFEAIVGVPFTHHRKGGHVGVLTVADRITASTHDLAVLATLRDPRSMLRSTYLQEVSKGNPHTYGQYLRTVRSGRRTREHPFNFVTVLSRYADRLGDDRVAVISLDELHNRPQESWSAIAERVSMPRLAELGALDVGHKNTTAILAPRVELFVNRRVLPVGGGWLTQRLRHTVYAPVRARSATGDRHWAAYFADDLDNEQDLVEELDVEFAEVFEHHGIVTDASTTGQPVAGSR